MKYTKKDIKRFRIINLILVLISILIIIFWSKAVGFPLLALAFFFLFTPYSKEDIKKENEHVSEYLPDDIISERKKLGLIDNNFIIIAKMISSYYKEFNTPKYKDRFRDKIALFTTIGVLDAQVYVFTKKNISIQEIQDLAKQSLIKSNTLLEFTLGMGILISKAEEPDFLPEDIEFTWDSQRESLNQVINDSLHGYLKNPHEEIVKGHVEMFLNIPQTLEIRKLIGIMNP